MSITVSITRVIPDANSRRPRCTKFASGMTRGNFSKSNRQTWVMKWISSIYIYFYQLKTVWQHCHLYLRISYLFDQPRMDYSAWSNTEAFDHIVEGSSRKAFWSIRPNYSSFCRSWQMLFRTLTFLCLTQYAAVWKCNNASRSNRLNILTTTVWNPPKNSQIP